MKKSILIIGLSLLSFAGTAQTRDKQGNFSATAKTTVAHDSTTTFTYTDAKGNIEPVYKGKKGSFYVARTSAKTGKYYRKYMKKED